MPELRLSGDLENTNGGIVVAGPNGKIILEKGVIIAKRHIHCGAQEAKENNFHNGDVVSVKIDGERGLVFDNVIIRVADNFSLAMHVDTDEANAAGINKTGKGEIL
jgi:putative phosphotransacetylase